MIVLSTRYAQRWLKRILIPVGYYKVGVKPNSFRTNREIEGQVAKEYPPFDSGDTRSIIETATDADRDTVSKLLDLSMRMARSAALGWANDWNESNWRMNCYTATFVEFGAMFEHDVLVESDISLGTVDLWDGKYLLSNKPDYTVSLNLTSTPITQDTLWSKSGTEVKYLTDLECMPFLVVEAMDIIFKRQLVT